MLPEWRRNQLIRGAAQFLKDTCTVEQQAVVTGDYGEEVVQWSLVAAGVKCRVIQAARQSGSAVQESGSQETLEQLYRLIVPVTVEIGINQRVTVGGQLYQIVRVESSLTDEIFRTAVIVRR